MRKYLEMFINSIMCLELYVKVILLIICLYYLCKQEKNEKKIRKYFVDSKIILIFASSKKEMNNINNLNGKEKLLKQKTLSMTRTIVLLISL